MRGQEEALLGRVGDLGVDDGAWRDVAHATHALSWVVGEEAGLVPLLGHHERDAGLVVCRKNFKHHFSIK